MRQEGYQKIVRSILSFCYAQVSFSELPDELFESVKTYIKSIPLKIRVLLFVSASWIYNRDHEFENKGSFN
jgi:hypothetical protein